MKKNLLNIAKYIIFASIGGGLFWLAVRNEDPANIREILSEANYWWVLLAVFVALFSHLSRAIRWNLLLRSMGYQARNATTFWAVMVGYFANLAVPRLGEVTRAGIVSKSYSIPVDKVFGTVIVERLLDLICLVVLFIAAILFQLDLLGDFVDKNILGPLSGKMSSSGLILVGAMIFLLLIAILVYILLKRYQEKLSGYKMFALYYRLQAGFLEGIKSIRQIKNLKAFIFHTVIIWLGYISMIYFSFFCLPETSHFNFVDAVTIMAIGSFGVVAPAPGGIGAYQFIVTMLLIEVYKLNSTVAVTFANISFFSQWLMMIGMGLISLLVLFFISKRKKSHENIGNHSE
ncbi:MAG: flippase-like domain-containing protein [Bacteroidetes bacterium]|nr:flippase-like domain-containing protein [Bacteroidota bacterium]MBU1717606.1 flippase-like domain-containing protein [Bacteroidota bacterium]